MSKPIMTVVGFGPMGKRFTRLFSSDISVRVSSSRNVGEEVAEIGATIVADRGHALPPLITFSYQCRLRRCQR